MTDVDTWSHSYRFRTFYVGDVQAPTVMVGTSPFIGAGQFGTKAEFYYNHFFLRPDNITAVLMEAIDLGVNAIQTIGYPRVVEAVQEAAGRTGTELFIIGTVGLGSIDREIDIMLEAGAQAVIIHGSLADRDLPFARQYLTSLNERGLVTGIATHRPGMTIPRVEAMEEVEIILCPLNKLGRFMEPSEESTLGAVEASSKTILAMKPLAAGSLSPEEGLASIADKATGVAVGIASADEAVRTFAAAEKHFGAPRRGSPE
jgi:hypothetical protein